MRRSAIQKLIAIVILLLLLLAACGKPAAQEEQAAETIGEKVQQTTEAAEDAQPSAEETTEELFETASLKLAEFRNGHEPILQTETYDVYELPFERDGLHIYGQLFLPDEAAGRLDSPEKSADLYPLVIIGHGLQSSYMDCIPDAQAFADAGIAAYVFDFCGGSFYSSSDGDFFDMSPLTEKEDMRAVLDGLKDFAFFDVERIFLMGESQGGFAAALLAAEKEPDVAGLILFFPGFVIPDNARLIFGSREHIPEDPPAAGYPLGYRYYSDVIDMDPYEEIRQYDKPVLIVHGDNDQVVPLSYSEKAAEVYPDAQLLVLPDAEHGFVDSYLSEACAAAVSFVLQR